MDKNVPPYAQNPAKSSSGLAQKNRLSVFNSPPSPPMVPPGKSLLRRLRFAVSSCQSIKCSNHVATNLEQRKSNSFGGKDSFEISSNIIYCSFSECENLVAIAVQSVENGIAASIPVLMYQEKIPRFATYVIQKYMPPFIQNRN
jgi:hypothetical protein